MSLQLEENLLNYVKSLVKDIDIDFWGNGRFSIHTDRHMVSHKEGKCCSLSYDLESMTDVSCSMLSSILQEFSINQFDTHFSKFFANPHLSIGKIRLCKSLRAWSIPQLISVSPVAVVGGVRTPLLLRGRSLRAPGTRQVIDIKQDRLFN